jgi:DNA-binding transcriptional ArsR family regulator
MNNMDSPNDIDRLIHEPARLLIMSTLAVVEKADYTFLMNNTGLTWGNLSSHMSKLEEAGYIAIEKTYKHRKPQTLASMTQTGEVAFASYRQQMQSLLGDT